MCESDAYIVKEGQEKLILEGIDLMVEEENRIRLVNLDGEEKRVRARVKVLSLVDHKIVLEAL